MIHHLAQRLERQVRSTADFAKMETGQYQLHTECFDLLGLIYQVIRAASGDAARRELSMKVRYEGESLEERQQELMIEADRFYIEQMITNLLVNAIEASPKEQTLSVDITTDSPLHIRMTNTGTRFRRRFVLICLRKTLPTVRRTETA